VILIARSGEPSAQLGWHFARKVHVEPFFADAPCNQWVGVRENDGEKSCRWQAQLIRTDQISGAAIRENEKRKQLFEIFAFPAYEESTARGSRGALWRQARSEQCGARL